MYSAIKDAVLANYQHYGRQNFLPYLSGRAIPAAHSYLSIKLGQNAAADPTARGFNCAPGTHFFQKDLTHTSLLHLHASLLIRK